jgi:hypothetical protein
MKPVLDPKSAPGGLGSHVMAQCDRILEIPAAIDEHGRSLTAFRAEKRKVEHQIESLEASIRINVIGTEAYKALKNKEDRDAYFRLALDQSESWTKKIDRLDQLLTAIDKHTQARDVLDHERKALKAALERVYAEIIEAALSDKTLAEAMRQYGNRAAA